MSESDVAKMIAEESNEFHYALQQRKRPREVCEGQLDDFKDEIKSMIKEMMETQNQILNRLNKDVAVVKAQNTSIQSSNQEIEKSMQFLSDQFDRMTKRIDSLEKERKEHLLYINTLVAKFDDIQRSLKSTSFELRNVPLQSKKEDKELINLALKTGKILEVDLHSSDIKDVYRIKGKTGTSTVVVDLTRAIIKQGIVTKAKSFNKQHPNDRLSSNHLGLPGKPVPIYVSESLTNKGRRLLYLARSFASSNEYKYCWTSNGKVYLRKADDSPHMEVRTEADLNNLKDTK